MNDIVVEHLTPPGDVERLRNVLLEMDEVIVPPLSDRIDINEYSAKLAALADAFYIVKDDKDIGNCAVYLNDTKYGFISSIAVKAEYHRNGYGKQLWEKVKKAAYEKGIYHIRLEVLDSNFKAIDFYKKMGFYIVEKRGNWIMMQFDDDRKE